MDITPILEAFLTLAATIITLMVVPYLKSKLTTEQQVQLKAWVNIGVAAAEQIYRGPGHGESKKRWVLTFLQDKGYKVDIDTLSALIEAEVNMLWQDKVIEIVEEEDSI